MSQRCIQILLDTINEVGFVYPPQKHCSNIPQFSEGQIAQFFLKVISSYHQEK